jgi:hypothetical protein
MSRPPDASDPSEAGTTGPDATSLDSAPVDPPPGAGGFPADDEPDARGTLLIVTVFLMALAGLWIIMYLTLLSR